MRGLPLRHLLLLVFTLGALVYVVAPLAIVVLNSFSSVAYSVFPPPGFSLRWYANLFEQTAFGIAALRSVVLATAATALSLAIGTTAAYGLVRHRPRGADILKAALMSPIVLPKIVLGVALFMFFVRVGLINTEIGLLLAHTLVTLPYVVAMLTAALMNFDWSLVEAASDLGARPLRSFRKVVLPQISTSMIIAGIFAWITSFDQVESTIFLVRAGTTTLPIEMFLYLQKWQDPTIAALSSLLILFAILLLLALDALMRRRRLTLEILNRGH
jgi:putative spermidine/putrescine transport system permease protein